MPNMPFRPCKKSGCPGLTRDKSGYCEKHQHLEKQRKREAYKRYNKTRRSACKQGYDRTWERVAKAKLIRDPLCECDRCQAGKLCVTPADMVHHIVPVETHPHLRLVASNLMSVNRRCHNRIHAEMERGKR